MANDEIKLYEFLEKYGEPQNIFIGNNILTFNLLNPVFGYTMTAVIKFQEELGKLFPKYVVLNKIHNDQKHYWIVLLKE